MIDVNEAKLVTLAEIEAGNLALSFGYGHLALPVLISQDGGAKGMLRLRGEFCSAQDDFRSPLIAFGAPVVRFDHESAVDDDKDLDDGTLVITPDGPAMFENTGRTQANAGRITLLSGTRASFYRNREVLAFARWVIGYLRGQGFVEIAAIKAMHNRFKQDR